MTDDDIGFLKAIHEQPADRLRRLVYADLLEDRGDDLSKARAQYLRLECDLEEMSDRNDERRSPAQQKLAILSRMVGNDWWQMIDAAQVGYCLEFEFQCPKRWDMLSLSDNPNVRFCDSCNQNVHFAHSYRDAQQLATAGQCVAVDSRQPKKSLARLLAGGGRRMLMGKILPPAPPARIPLAIRGPEQESAADSRESE